MQALQEQSESRNRAALDRRDVVADLTLDQQLVIAHGLCATSPANANGRSAVITWAPDSQSFTSEAGDEQTARWAGYHAFREEIHEYPEHAQAFGLRSKQTERGTWAVQFEIEVAA